MGKLLVVILVMVTIILASVLVSIQSKSGDIADLLSSNMSEIKARSLSNEALLYGIKQLNTGNLSVSETEMTQAFQNFDVIDGKIDSIKYVINTGDTIRITSYVTAVINEDSTQYISTAEVNYSGDGTFENIITTSYDLRGNGVGNSFIDGNVMIDVNDLSFEEVFGISLARMRRFADHDYTDPPNNVSPVEGITYIEGDAAVQRQWSGSGILIVDGTFRMNGGYFEGIIWVEEGELVINAGTVVNGAIFIKDEINATYPHINGNCTLTYDQTIVEELLGILGISAPSSQLKILTWSN